MWNTTSSWHDMGGLHHGTTETPPPSSSPPLRHRPYMRTYLTIVNVHRHDKCSGGRVFAFVAAIARAPHRAAPVLLTIRRRRPA